MRFFNFAVPFVFLSAFGCTRANITNKAVIDVNGQTMTAVQFGEELAFRLRELDALAAKDPVALQRTKNRIVEDFIVQVLSAQWAKDNGLLLKAEDVEAEVNKFRVGYPDDLAFQQGLAEQGMTFKTWRGKLEQSLLQKLVIRKLSESLPKPADSEILAYYQAHKVDFMEKETVQIRQIILPTESDARTIEDQLKKGRSLTSLIPKFSSQGQGISNPSVIWVRRGESQVFDSAFKMKVGRISPILKSEFGYHIFELLAHKLPKPKPVGDLKPTIQRILMEKSEQTAYLSWLDAQLRKARVFKDLELINAMKVETKAD
jgi:parvulin-like peptidyl-prolyl isomerase